MKIENYYDVDNNVAWSVKKDRLVQRHEAGLTPREANKDRKTGRDIMMSMIHGTRMLCGLDRNVGVSKLPDWAKDREQE